MNPQTILDMSSATILANALSDFEGTVLFVSLNRSFIDDVATHIYAIQMMDAAAYLKEIWMITKSKL